VEGVCEDCVEEKKWVVKHFQWKGVVEIEFRSVRKREGQNHTGDGEEFLGVGFCKWV